MRALRARPPLRVAALPAAEPRDAVPRDAVVGSRYGDMSSIDTSR